MSWRGVLTTIAVLGVAAVIGPAAATAQDDDLAPIVPIFKQATYDVKARGSVSVDWTQKSGEVDKRCAVWSDESGSSTMSFRSKTGRVIVIWNAGNPWRLTGQVDASTKRIRSWKRRYGREDTAGCPGVCPPGTAARAADGTCEPAKPAPGPGRDDCGRRTTRRTSVPFGIEPRAEDDDDLADLVFPDDPAKLAVGAPLFSSGFFRQCRTYDEGFLQASLPVKLTNTDVGSVRTLAKGRSRSFRATRVGVDCADPSDKPRGVTCSLDYDVQVTIRRVR